MRRMSGWFWRVGGRVVFFLVGNFLKNEEDFLASNVGGWLGGDDVARD